MMKVVIGKDKLDMAQQAADAAADKIRKAIAENGEARIIVATGASQFEFLQALVKEPGIDWTKVTGFHLDEYVGLPVTHKASFRGYMRERFVSKTPQPMKVFNEVNGEAADTEAEIARLEALIRTAPIDVACIRRRTSTRTAPTRWCRWTRSAGCNRSARAGSRIWPPCPRTRFR